VAYRAFKELLGYDTVLYATVLYRLTQGEVIKVDLRLEEYQK